MAIRLESKRPDEVRDYRHDWSLFLDGDTILTSVFVSDDVTVDDEENDTTSATVWVSGGVIGTRARIEHTITTAGGRTEIEIFTLLISDSEEPISLAEAKAHLRKTDDSEDALICRNIVSAREWVENYTGHIIVRRPIVETFGAFGDYLTLKYRPLVTLDEVLYTDANGDEAEYADGVLRSFGYPAKIHPPSGATFPTLGTNGLITATYTAGYAEGSVPEDMILAMRVLITGVHVERGGPGDDALKAAKNLLREYYKPALA